MNTQFSAGQSVEILAGLVRRRHGVVVASLRNGAYLVDLLPQARRLEAEGADPAQVAATFELEDVRRYPAWALRATGRALRLSSADAPPAA